MLEMLPRRNVAMLSLLGGDAAFTEPSSFPIPDGLIRLVEEGVERMSGMIFLRSLASSRGSSLEYMKRTDDETGIEAAISEIHVEDFLDTQLSSVELARLGCDFAFFLAKKVQQVHPEIPLRVIVSAIPAGTLDNVRDTCVVRFHQRREHQVWLNENLESYREEAIEVLDF
jgi:hypothetical protein